MYLFNLYLNNIWPIHKKFIKVKLTKRCRNCLLPQDLPGADIKEDLCIFCRTQQSKIKNICTKNIEEEIEKLFWEVYKKRLRYHCLLLISGGKDSAYLGFLLKKKYHLRILGLTVNTYFLNSIVLKNIKKIVSNLDIDHILLKPRFALYKNLYRYCLLNYYKKGCYKNLCIACNTTFHLIGLDLAKKLEIPLVITALSPAQLFHFLKINTFKIEKNIFNSLMPMDLQKFLIQMLENICVIDVKDLLSSTFPYLIAPYAIWKYDEEFISREVVRLNLISPGNQLSIRTACKLIPLVSSLDILNQGYWDFEIEIASLIRNKESKKQRWLSLFQFLEYYAKSGKFLTPKIKSLLETLEISPSEIGIY